ncbi:ankyrin repeat domain-containing protein [Cardinium endosymbiont of Culicoides punctatus]|uniref:ankyrin repeat domain-containing protein n=1 Tax=Cardinium endosymbiont of Culicoides punctatus TaxID=2304601 RepID=UPI0010F28C15|nr:ankyrin repeat domain-containing protein [Cardinium endosymbiont of Culicoides punctatus]TDG95717.1 hypothetical protein CCPUN_00010 [Cardinium endosymbiont of Culicoides punctatus]
MINTKYISLIGILCLGSNCGNDSGKGKTTGNILANKNDSSDILAGKIKPSYDKGCKQHSCLPLNLSEGNISNESYLDNTSFNATNKSYSNEISLQKKNRPNGCLTDELCEAIKNNDLNLVESLLDAGADLNKNAEALLTAIENNNPEITRLLLEAGANPNIPDENGYYPLDAAIDVNNKALVTLLLKAGAHIRFCGTHNYKLYYNLMDIDIDKSILEILLIHLGRCGEKDYEGLSPLHWAAKDGYTGVIRDLMDSGQSLNYDEVDPVYNFTPLHYASRKGNKKIVEMLLAQGANRTAQDFRKVLNN